ncbi:MAG: helix-turn-helix transcriptional regulator [Syntrophomonadaceae bacterium]|nr:helix-turn-helix transcriptional regulator [Syntrophomonadaceae bacterium]
MDLGQALSLRIIELCQEKRITINKLALLSGLTQSTVDSILKGKSKSPRLATLMRISEGLGVTICEFLDDTKIEEADLGE